MNELTTNRDLYLAVTRLTESKTDSLPSLEAYLITLRQLGMTLEKRDSILLDDFYALIRDAFSIQPIRFDDAWVNEYVIETDETGFQGWRRAITNQIVDLHEMARLGTLQNAMRYFGVESPRRSHWVNFDVRTYLECAMTGTVGGWEPDDDSDRMFVSGPVAVLDENGRIVTMNPEDVPRPVYPLPVVSWDLFRDFLQAGQQYE